MLDFVLAENAMRRDMYQSQRAIVAARLASHYSEPARLRKLANLAQYADGAMLPHRDEEGRVAAILERKISVSATYIKRALRLLVEHGVAPDESGYRALEAMRGYIEAAQMVYQEGAGTMLAGTVIERPPLPPPAPEPVADLLAEALRLGAIVGITPATTRRATPATPERTWTPWGGKWGGAGSRAKPAPKGHHTYRTKEEPMLIDDILLLPAQERERLHPVFPDLGHAQVYDITDVQPA